MGRHFCLAGMLLVLLACKTARNSPSSSAGPEKEGQLLLLSEEERCVESLAEDLLERHEKLPFSPVDLDSLQFASEDFGPRILETASSKLTLPYFYFDLQPTNTFELLQLRICKDSSCRELLSEVFLSHANELPYLGEFSGQTVFIEVSPCAHDSRSRKLICAAKKTRSFLWPVKKTDAEALSAYQAYLDSQLAFAKIAKELWSSACHLADLGLKSERKVETLFIELAADYCRSSPSFLAGFLSGSFDPLLKQASLPSEKPSYQKPQSCSKVALGLANNPSKPQSAEQNQVSEAESFAQLGGGLFVAGILIAPMGYVFKQTGFKGSLGLLFTVVGSIVGSILGGTVGAGTGHWAAYLAGGFGGALAGNVAGGVAGSGLGKQLDAFRPEEKIAESNRFYGNIMLGLGAAVAIAGLALYVHAHNLQAVQLDEDPLSQYLSRLVQLNAAWKKERELAAVRKAVFLKFLSE